MGRNTVAMNEKHSIPTVPARRPNGGVRIDEKQALLDLMQGVLWALESSMGRDGCGCHGQQDRSCLACMTSALLNQVRAWIPRIEQADELWSLAQLREFCLFNWTRSEPGSAEQAAASRCLWMLQDMHSEAYRLNALILLEGEIAGEEALVSLFHRNPELAARIYEHPRGFYEDRLAFYRSILERLRSGYEWMS